MQTINYHLMDGRGVYIATVQIDPMAALPGRGTLSALPPEEPGMTRMWDGQQWQLVPDAEVPVPAVPAPAVPQSVTPAQGLVALYALKGITETDLHAAIDQIADPVQQYTARIGVTRTTEWLRGSETTQGVADLMGLTGSDMDALFIYASGVQL